MEIKIFHLKINLISHFSVIGLKKKRVPKNFTEKKREKWPALSEKNINENKSYSSTIFKTMYVAVLLIIV